MRLSEELFVGGVILGLVASVPFICWRKLARQEWISLYSIALAKEWHKPKKTSVAHLRSQARTDFIRVFQQEGMPSHFLQPLDDLNHKLTSMEDSVEDIIRPVWTPWLCVLVCLEMLQYLAVPFALKIHWDRKSAWKLVPDVFSCFLPNPADQKVYDLTTWVILTPLYAAAFCILWIVMLGLCVRYLPWLNTKESLEHLGDAFVKLMLFGRKIFVSCKETFFDFGTLFILTGIIRSLFNEEGRLECYWPTSLLILVLFYGVTLRSDEGTNSLNWIHRITYLFFLNRTPHLLESLPTNDHVYYGRSLSDMPNNRDLLSLHLHFSGHQRPTFSSRWIFLCSTAKLIIATLFVLAHFEDFWAWVLLFVSSILFIVLLRESVKYGSCTFQWINVFQSIGLISALWGNACGLLAQGLHARPDITYAFTPTVVFVVGICVILGSAPFCVFLSQRLFACSPLRLHPLKLQVIHSYFKFVAMGRIASIKDSLNSDQDPNFRSVLNGLLQDQEFNRLSANEQKSSANKLLINHELWVAWIKKNAHLFKIGHIELSMREKMDVCSKRSLAQCMPAPEDCTELSAIREIRNWMDQAELTVDPAEDVELGLRVPDDEYLSFADGAPIFTGDCGSRIFSDKSLRSVNITSNHERRSSPLVRVHADIESTHSGDQSLSGSLSPQMAASSHSRPTFKSWGSHYSIQQPCRQETSERPNRICFMMEENSHASADSPTSKTKSCH